MDSSLDQVLVPHTLNNRKRARSIEAPDPVSLWKRGHAYERRIIFKNTLLYFCAVGKWISVATTKIKDQHAASRLIHKRFDCDKIHLITKKTPRENAGFSYMEIACLSDIDEITAREHKGKCISLSGRGCEC